MSVPISNVVRRIVFAPSGTGPYAFTFEILAATDIEVYKGDTLLTLTTDYTVTINPNGTGSVTLVATAGTDNITIVGARTIQRTTDFVTGGDLFANSLNEELDSLTIFTQQNAEAGDRSIRAPVTDPTTIDMTLPTKTARAGKYLSFNASTGNPEVVNTVLDITAVANNTANINTVAGQISPVNNISTVAGAATNIATVAGIAANVTTVAGISGNVTTVAGISANVTSVAGNATNINTVAGLSTEIAALGPIAADITTVAGIDSDVTAVAADATDIGTVASNIANVNTVAGISSNVTTVAGISADVTAVAGDATDIGTVAGIASNVTTVAGIAANVTTVAGISSDVTTVATNVADITNFSDVYLGPKSSDPATRNDSSALQAGDLYFDTVADAMKVYDGANWVAAYISGTGFVDLSSTQTITGVKTFDNGFKTDTISEETAAAGVTVDGVLLKDSEVTTDVIKEKTSAAGVTIDSVLLKDNKVTANELTINSNNISADNSLGFRNRIINGDMRIDQRNAGANISIPDSAATSFPVDRFGMFDNTSGALDAQQVSSAPVGFVNSLKVTTTTADASVTGSEQCWVRQRIEGFNVADLGWGTASAKTVTLSFWVRSSLTGTFAGAFQNSAGDRAYPFTYTISSADTWEQKTITIAGETSGTWLTTNGVGVQIFWSLGIGPDLQATAGAWTSGNKRTATGETQVIGTLNATWFITGVQLEVGSVATPFERRPYGTELALCQRYFYILCNGTAQTIPTGSYYNSTLIAVAVQLPVEMRTAPSIYQVSGTDYFIIYANNTSDTFNAFTGLVRASSRCVAIDADGGGVSGTVGHSGPIATNNAAARLGFQAEL